MPCCLVQLNQTNISIFLSAVPSYNLLCFVLHVCTLLQFCGLVLYQQICGEDHSGPKSLGLTQRYTNTQNSIKYPINELLFITIWSIIKLNLML